MSQITVWDFDGALAVEGADGYQIRDAARQAIRDTPKDVRLGLLAVLPQDVRLEDLRLLLRDALIEEPFDPTLIVNAAALPVGITDQRCFAVLAALAGTAPGAIEFITFNAERGAAARAAGLIVRQPPEDLASPGLLAAVDEDTGPAYVLKGRIVTMDGDDRIIKDGRVAIRKGVIVAVLEPQQPLPPGFAGKPVVDTGATIYPGLIDLHNHYAFNIHQLWSVPKKYDNRSAWQRDRTYQIGVRNATAYMARLRRSAEAMARYVEAKAIVGGVTAGQGIRMKVARFTGLTKGLMRNVEITGDERLPEAGTRIPDMFTAEHFESFDRALDARRMFYHLSEGTSERVRDHFLNLKSRSLLKPNLVGIHALALQPDDFTALGQGQSKVVWSPFSNLLLYGQTLNPKHLKDAGIDFSIGCDWSPSGGKNMLQELKVARWAAEHAGAALTNRELVEAVTSAPARLLGWEDTVGQIRKGALADLVAVSGTAGDPWSLLVDATEADIALVTIHGIPRYGERPFMEALIAKSKLERVSIDGRNRSFFFEASGSPLNGVSLSEAITRLDDAMSNLQDIREEALSGGPGLLSLAESEFELILDMPEADPDDPTGVEPGLLAAEDGVLDEMTRDELWVTADDIALVRPQKNLPAGLADALGEVYE
jgi:5-methylthioadenosine/S-adenosylhomocysteine deaminase